MKGGSLRAAARMPGMGEKQLLRLAAVFGVPGRAGAAHVVALGPVRPGRVVAHGPPDGGETLAEKAEGVLQQGCR